MPWKVGLQFSEGSDLEDGFRRISGVLEKLDAFLDSVPGLDAGGKADLRLVCDEIGSNVVRHSTPEKPTRLDIEVDTSPESVRLRILDNGSEFNPCGNADPYVGSELDRRAVGGLGLYLIRKLFPLTTYRRIDGWNISEVEYFMGEDGWKKMRRAADAHQSL